MRNIFQKLTKNFITIIKGSAEISKTREVSVPPIREVEHPSVMLSKASSDEAKLKHPVDPSSPQASQDDEVAGTGGSLNGQGNLGTGAGIGADSLICPFCASKKFIKRGFRQKKREKVQLLLCLECNRTFTPHLVKGKHYPLATIFDALALYNLGFSLEESCRRVRPAPRPSADIDRPLESGASVILNEGEESSSIDSSALPQNDNGGGGQGSSTSGNIGTGTSISASSLANWLNEFRDRMPFLRMRDFAMQKYTPFNMVTSATLAHRQLYKFHFHHAKCELIMQENFHHKTFQPLKEFLEMVPGECPHQYFSAKDESFRASDLSASSKSPISFSKTAMIVRGKRNYATMMAEFVLQSVKDRTKRHEALQKYFLYNDSVTIATEVPVYLTNDDLEHMQTQLGFEIYLPGADILKADLLGVPDDVILSDSEESSSIDSSALPQNDNGGGGQGSSTSDNIGTGTVDLPNGSTKGNGKVGEVDTVDARSAGTISKSESNSALGLPRLITGHIDFLQIRNGMIHILDYKPKAEKEKPIEQLTLYAMALSRLTGLRLFEFKCAWFDEKDYFEFYPLHVLHKPKKARKRKKVDTQEGVYLVNKDVKKIKSVRPI